MSSSSRRTARDLYQQTGDRHGEGRTWTNLSEALADVWRFDEAITAAEHAVVASTETGAADDADLARRLIQAIRDASRHLNPVNPDDAH